MSIKKMEIKMKVLNFIKFILMLLWQLPQSIIGWLMLLYFYIFGQVEYVGKYKTAYIFRSNKMMGAISLGTIIIADKYKTDASIQHECGHVEQSNYLGWLYLFVIGIESIVWAACYKKLGYDNYYEFYTESWANKLGCVKAIRNKNNYVYLQIAKKLDIVWA